MLRMNRNLINAVVAMRIEMSCCILVIDTPRFTARAGIAGERRPV